MSYEIPVSLSYERIMQARETLLEAFVLFCTAEEGVTARQREDAMEAGSACVEAKRRLSTLMGPLHGQEALDRVLDEDAS